MSIVMVHGTEGHLDYLAIARKGNLVLSIKPNAIVPGEMMNVPSVTYFGARIRSAPILSGEFDAYDAEAGIAGSIGNFPASDAWGGIEWEKMHVERASGQVGVFLNGTIQETPEKLVAEFAEGGMAAKFADFLIGQAGDGVTLIVTKEELSQWLDATFAPRLKAIVGEVKKKAEVDAEIQEKIAGSVGVFASQTSLLKGIFKKHKVDEVADKEDADDAPSKPDDVDDSEEEYTGD